jgi:hypothetical protein
MVREHAPARAASIVRLQLETGKRSAGGWGHMRVRRSVALLCKAGVLAGLVSSALCCRAAECPLYVLDGTSGSNNFSVRVRIVGKLPVRQIKLEAPGMGDLICDERNISFYPGSTYSLRCEYPQGPRFRKAVRLNSVVMSDGSRWRRRPHQVCGSAEIQRKTKAQ